MSVLDTNVYNTSNRLSCKIDKTAPVGSTTRQDNNYSFINFNDNLSGLTSVKVISHTNLDSDSNQSVILNGSTYYNGTIPSEIKITSNISNSNNWRIYDNGGHWIRVQLQFTDKAGNTSIYEYYKGNGANATCTKK